MMRHICLLLIIGALSLSACGSSNKKPPEPQTDQVMLQATIEALQATVDASVSPVPDVSPTIPAATPTPSLGIGSTMTSEQDGMELVYVPAGEFTMGSPEARGYDFEPQHMVYLDAFWIDKTEVTAAQYRRCVEAGTCSVPPDAGPWCTYGDASKLDHPINCVDWNQAAVYCGWAGRRLPTEAEWEKAALGTDGRAYPWGEQEPTGELLNFSDGSGNTSYATTVGNGNELIAPADSYPGGASPYGALNMAGNVSEWVADWYDHTYYGSSPRENPQGPASGEQRVMRGGSFSSDADSVRTAYRDPRDPADGFVDDDWGFRCARSS